MFFLPSNHIVLLCKVGIDLKTADAAGRSEEHAKYF